MKISITMNIGNYENIKIETSEHQHGDADCNVYECNKEILEVLEKYIGIFPELDPWVYRYQRLRDPGIKIK